MAANFELDPEAEAEISSAYDWYEGQRDGLGEAFMARVDDCFEAVRRTPLMHQIHFKQYRRGFVRRFPYVVIYRYFPDTDTVAVYSVFHTSQDPRKWQNRLS
jgi:plasmid stabilization system protein ParE